MEKIMAVLETVNGWVNNFVWGVPVLLLILGTGIFYTIRLGFLQFRHPAFLFKETVVKAFKKQDSPEICCRWILCFNQSLHRPGR